VIKHLERHGILVAIFELTLRWVAFPIARLESAVTQAVTWRIDLFQLVAALLAGILLWFRESAWLLLVAWSALRIADLVHVYLCAFCEHRAPTSKPRAVLLLFLHYAEIIVLFAGLYLAAQHFVAQPALFLKGLEASDARTSLSVSQAIFFSLVTATVGFADIYPNHLRPLNEVGWVYALHFTKTAIIIAFTLVEFSRVMSSPDSRNAA
jgi:hypothetical protein